MKSKYQVNLMIDHIYEVLDTDNMNRVFLGNLSECYAWIKLKEESYI